MNPTFFCDVFFCASCGSFVSFSQLALTVVITDPTGCPFLCLAELSAQARLPRFAWERESAGNTRARAGEEDRWGQGRKEEGVKQGRNKDSERKRMGSCDTGEQWSGGDREVTGRGEGRRAWSTGECGVGGCRGMREACSMWMHKAASAELLPAICIMHM